MPAGDGIYVPQLVSTCLTRPARSYLSRGEIFQLGLFALSLGARKTGNPTLAENLCFAAFPAFREAREKKLGKLGTGGN